MAKVRAIEKLAVEFSGPEEEPRGEAMKSFAVKLPPILAANIEGLAEKAGLTRTEVIRRLLDAAIEDLLVEMHEKDGLGFITGMRAADESKEV